MSDKSVSLFLDFGHEEEWEFIASAKGRYGWGHHPYTQNTVDVPMGH